MAAFHDAGMGDAVQGGRKDAGVLVLEQDWILCGSLMLIVFSKGIEMTLVLMMVCRLMQGALVIINASYNHSLSHVLKRLVVVFVSNGTGLVESRR